MDRPRKVSMVTRNVGLATIALIASAFPVQKNDFATIQTFDMDGFGPDRAIEYQTPNPSLGAIDGQSLFGQSDFTADLNPVGTAAIHQGYDFDRRNLLEMGDRFRTDRGFNDQETTGYQFAHLSLSISSVDNFFSRTPLKGERQELLTEQKTIQTQINELNTRIHSIDSNLAPLWMQRDELVSQRQAVQAEINQLDAQVKEANKQDQNHNQFDALNVIQRELLARRRDINAKIMAINIQTKLFLSQQGSLNLRRQELITQQKTIQADLMFWRLRLSS
ncbi:MAG: hypothetical protein QNJ46_26030 [Leptolyngbyaceae cyanobacterium MO_188.B28]|nr:hypothetical protein [Leptolyngbyaceae cyanobacterium MO_188.B28]